KTVVFNDTLGGNDVIFQILDQTRDTDNAVMLTKDHRNKKSSQPSGKQIVLYPIEPLYLQSPIRQLVEDMATGMVLQYLFENTIVINSTDTDNAAMILLMQPLQTSSLLCLRKGESEHPFVQP
ncbi:hypothetical protein RYX36_024997, partial [Vicia faba]